MKAFLDQVAGHYFMAGGIEGKCFIFPNRRSMVFFRNYLGKYVKKSGRPMIAPAMYTVNDFFYKVCGKNPTDRVHLLLELYECYKRLNPKAEPLDDFIFWGDVLLADFDDTDKYLADAKGLFSNISDLKEIRDKYDYLSENQKEAIERFLAHFHTVGDVKKNFLSIWEILYKLYSEFNSVLREKGLCYEGMVYRELAERTGSEPVVDILNNIFPGKENFIFIGLNALNNCEKTLMRKMHSAGIAEFCWDYDPDGIIGDPANKASFFMRDNISDFPQAFTPDAGESMPETEFNILSIPSSTGQAAQLPVLLDEGAGIDTAIVLPDENLLIPVLNSIPAAIRDINVTMGYPISGSSLHSLMSQIAALQMHMRQKDGQWYFYHKQVSAIFSNSIIKAAAGEEGKQKAAEIRKAARYYVPQNAFSGIKAFELVFRPVIGDTAAASAETVAALIDYQKEILSGIAAMIRDLPGMNMELDFAMEYYKAIGRLGRYRLDILPATYFRLLTQLTGSQTVPFKGEPLKGLQIMGPLETRALDFDNIIILSCNEGTFPRRSVASSFIPAELRKAFELPTYEYQDAVWAYYFYRMTRRAKKVWMVFDSRTEGLKAGEESRYIRQLELHFKKKTNRYTAKSPLKEKSQEGDIRKTEEHIMAIKSMELSASALQNYLECPARFYFASVVGLETEDEASESLDAAMTGNVFHKTMQQLYSPVGRTVTTEYLSDLLRDTAGIKAIVDSKIMEELHTFEVSGRNLISSDIIVQYVMKTLSRDLELCRKRGTDSFRILGLEKKCRADFGGFHFKGYIDRLDSFSPSEVRVVDYKTGHVSDEEIYIDDSNAENTVKNLFDPDNDKRPKIALQLYLYDMFIRDKHEFDGNRLINSIYHTSRLFLSEVEEVELSEEFCKQMETGLKALLEEMVDISVPFRRTDREKRCEYCDFKNICGR